MSYQEFSVNNHVKAFITNNNINYFCMCDVISSKLQLHIDL